MSDPDLKQEEAPDQDGLRGILEEDGPNSVGDMSLVLSLISHIVVAVWVFAWIRAHIEDVWWRFPLCVTIALVLLCSCVLCATITSVMSKRKKR